MSCSRRCWIICSHRAAKLSLLKDVLHHLSPCLVRTPPSAALCMKNGEARPGQRSMLEGGKCWVTDTHPDAKPSSHYLSHTTLVVFYHSKNNSTSCQISWTAREIFIRLFAFLINYSTTHLALQYFPPIFLQILFYNIILIPLLCFQLYTPVVVRWVIVLLIGRGNSLNTTGLGRGQIQWWVGVRWKGGRWAPCSLQFLRWQGLSACSRDKGRTGEGEREEGSEQKH